MAVYRVFGVLAAAKVGAAHNAATLGVCRGAGAELPTCAVEPAAVTTIAQTAPVTTFFAVTVEFTMCSLE
jgi:hypothetical protein